MESEETPFLVDDFSTDSLLAIVPNPDLLAVEQPTTNVPIIYVSNEEQRSSSSESSEVSSESEESPKEDDFKPNCIIKRWCPFCKKQYPKEKMEDIFTALYISLCALGFWKRITTTKEYNSSHYRFTKEQLFSFLNTHWDARGVKIESEVRSTILDNRAMFVESGGKYGFRMPSMDFKDELESYFHNSRKFEDTSGWKVNIDDFPKLSVEPKVVKKKRKPTPKKSPGDSQEADIDAPNGHSVSNGIVKSELFDEVPNGEPSGDTNGQINEEVEKITKNPKTPKTPKPKTVKKPTPKPKPKPKQTPKLVSPTNDHENNLSTESSVVVKEENGGNLINDEEAAMKVEKTEENQENPASPISPTAMKKRKRRDFLAEDANKFLNLKANSSSKRRTYSSVTAGVANEDERMMMAVKEAEKRYQEELSQRQSDALVLRDIEREKKLMEAREATLQDQKEDEKLEVHELFVQRDPDVKTKCTLVIFDVRQFCKNELPKFARKQYEKWNAEEVKRREATKKKKEEEKSLKLIQKMLAEDKNAAHNTRSSSRKVKKTYNDVGSDNEGKKKKKKKKRK